MRKTPIIAARIAPFVAGDNLLESDRFKDAVALPLLDDKDGGPLSFFKPGADDYKGLKKGLAFLKFSDADAETLFNVIGSVANLAASVSTVVGAFTAGKDLLEKLGILDKAADPTQEAVKRIETLVQGTYGYLGQQDQRELYNKAIVWRTKIGTIANDLDNLKISRSPAILDSLKNDATALDEAIRIMINSATGNIAFQRRVYGYQPGAGHWVDVAGTSYLGRADGAHLDNLSDPAQNLQAQIWDAGYYLDVLINSLQKRLEVAVALEPAYRSTGFDRGALGQLAQGLAGFINAWRGALLVASPTAGFGPDGKLQNPYQAKAPNGVLIGAVDPVMGISALSTWGNFDIKYSRTYIPTTAWGGQWDESHATDPAAALAGALVEHARLVDQLVNACGLISLQSLQTRLLQASKPPIGSDFVKLSEARYEFADLPSGLEPVTVDLGRLKRYSPSPSKTYQGLRSYQSGTKSFQFNMARRGEISHVQLGYKLRINGTDVELCPYSSQPPEGVASSPFPSGTIEKDMETTIFVYDCFQDRNTAPADEDSFESSGNIPGVTRVLLNERKGTARLHLTITFDPTPGSATDSYLGLAKVSVTNKTPRERPDACVLDVRVLETHLGSESRPDAGDAIPVEVLADAMTIHIVPSYIVVGKDFFDDLQSAMTNMARTIDGIKDKYSLQDITPPNGVEPDPTWGTLRIPTEIENGVRYLDALTSLGRQDIAADIQRFQPPLARR